MNLKGKELVDKFREMKRNWQRMGNTVLELCRHPDVTPDQVYEVAQRYRVVSQSVFEARRQIDEAVHREDSSTRMLWQDAREMGKP